MYSWLYLSPSGTITSPFAHCGDPDRHLSQVTGSVRFSGTSGLSERTRLQTGGICQGTTARPIRQALNPTRRAPWPRTTGPPGGAFASKGQGAVPELCRSLARTGGNSQARPQGPLPVRTPTIASAGQSGCFAFTRHSKAHHDGGGPVACLCRQVRGRRGAVRASAGLRVDPGAERGPQP